MPQSKDVIARSAARRWIPPAAQASPAVNLPPVSAAGLPENTAAALCYLLGLVTGIIFLVLEPYNKNKLIRFHAFQSIFLHVCVIIVWVAFSGDSSLEHVVFDQPDRSGASSSCGSTC